MVNYSSRLDIHSAFLSTTTKDEKGESSKLKAKKGRTMKAEPTKTEN